MGKSLSSCHLNNQRLINPLEAEVDESAHLIESTGVTSPYKISRFHRESHYYWERLLREGPRLEAFRVLFGDERVDYGQALMQHCHHGASADWPERFVSAYASAHPWEDWAETWAHYLHMTDALETAVACGLALQPLRSDEPALPTLVQDGRLGAFEERLEHWFALTYVLNKLNRSLGLPDGYPFILAPPVLDKLRFVHDMIAAG